jgi:hypothetical protein
MDCESPLPRDLNVKSDFEMPNEQDDNVEELDNEPDIAEAGDH